MNLFKKQDFNIIKEGTNKGKLDKTLGALDLMLFGLGCIIGTGVFVLTGVVAAKYSGPAVTLSYIIAGCTCVFVALAYTEIAIMLPTSGSVYTYSYVALGEVFAWLMGSILILELVATAGAVAAGWSGYMQAILKLAGITLPKSLTKIPAEGGILDLPAACIVIFVGIVLYLGTKDSKRINAILVAIKIGAIFAFILSAVPHVDVANWQDFMPFGFDNVVAGASILFFAFCGFGTITSTAEECKNPKRDLTIGIIGSLLVAIIIYVIVGGLATGIVHFSELNNAQPLAHALAEKGSKIGSAIVATGAVCGMTTVIMMNIYGISRIFYVIARDNLLPKTLASIHPKYGSPYVTVIMFSAIAALLGAFFPFQMLGQLSSMAALIDYIVIISIMMIFRIKLPKIHREFKCPAAFIVAPVAFVSSTYLLLQQVFDKEGNLLTTGKILICWLVMMFILYIIRSILSKEQRNLAI